MSKEFTKFYDIILAEGIFDIAPHAAPRLRLIADRLLRISSMVGTSSITSESEDSIMAKPAGSRKGLSDGSMHHGHQTTGMGEPDLSSSVYPHHPSSFNYEVIAQATPNNASFPFFASMESSSSQPPSSSYLGTSLGTSLNNPSPYPRLSSPTYAFHERFSKRLQRITLECGLRLATMKNPPPERYATVFGFSLLFESRDSIIRRLAAGLKKIQSEGVDWKFPTPSMQNDQFGYLENQFSSSSTEELNNALLSLGKSATGFANMPQFGTQSQTNSEEKAEHRIRMLCQNFEGEFFTADEVELFLRRLGLAIPPNVDYVDSELDLSELQAADEASTKSHFASIGLSPGNSGLSGIQSNMWQMNSPSVGEFGSSLRGDSSEGQNTETTELIDKTDLDGELVSFMNNHDFSQIWPSGSSWSKTKVSVDVARLIDGTWAFKFIQPISLSFPLFLITSLFTPLLTQFFRIGKRISLSGKDARYTTKRCYQGCQSCCRLITYSGTLKQIKF